MDDSTRREERNDRDRQHASRVDEEDREGRDELAERREQGPSRPALTPRERKDRWPIG
jgi:hypothetical protein